MLDFYAKTRIRFSLRDKRLFEIIEVEITRVDCFFCLLLRIKTLRWGLLKLKKKMLLEQQILSLSVDSYLDGKHNRCSSVAPSDSIPIYTIVY